MPPDEDLPVYPGHGKPHKSAVRETPRLTRQQQAEAKRVTIRRESRSEQEKAGTSTRRLPTVRHAAKKLTPYQEKVLGELYGDRLSRSGSSDDAIRDIASTSSSTSNVNGERWEASMLEALQAVDKPRSSSINSEELDSMLDELHDGFDRVQRNARALGRSRGDAVDEGSRSSDVEISAKNQDAGDTEFLPNTHQTQQQAPNSSHIRIDEAMQEVLQQFDEEDERESHGDTGDDDYVDERVSDTAESTCDEDVAAPKAMKPRQTEVSPKLNQMRLQESGDDVAAARIVDTVDDRGKVAGGVAAAGGFLEGFPIYWDSWEKFSKVFAEFQEATYQLFSCRTSTSVDSRNRIIAQEQEKVKRSKKKSKGKQSANRAATGGTLLPEAWTKYCRTYLCTHGMSYEMKGAGLRDHTTIRATGCTARVNARVRLRPGGAGFHLVVKATGSHNHRLTEHQWYNYVENRRINDPQLRHDVAVMTKAGAKPKGILAYLRSRTGKRTILRDVHNMIQEAKHIFRGGKTDAERALAVLDEFIEQSPGNTAEFIVDSESNIVRAVVFQSARQKRLFAAFPEVVLVDSTHGTNANRYKLFSFAVHDVFGRGQYVQHALVQTEEKPNLALAVEVFKRNNPAWTDIRVVMTDKALHEKDVLHQAWPKARQLLCRWHVETWLKRQCSRLGGVDKHETRKLKVIMKGLVNAESQQQYDDFKVALLETLGNDKDNHLYQSFMQHWDSTTEEWVMFKRGGVPHLQNHTNNRLESKWGRVKEIVDGRFTIDELTSMLITLQDYAEERYLADYHRIGSRPPMAEDPELTTVAMQLSDYAFKMVAQQHKLAVGPNASYDMDVRGEKTALMNPVTGETHVVNARLCVCDCIFMQTCLLPCRHVMYVRGRANYETVIPPLRTFSSRWIVHNPANNIDEGEVTTGALNHVNCPPIRALPPVDRDTKYSHGKQLTEKIIDVMSIQPSTTYRLAMKWLQGFHTALHTGKLEEFTGCEEVGTRSGFPNLSQISVADSVSLSQLSFGDPAVSNPLALEAKAAGPTFVSRVSSDPPNMPSEISAAKEKRKGVSVAEKGSAMAPIIFASPPKRKGLTRRAEKKDESRKEMKEAKRIQIGIREGKKAQAVKLSHMEILSGPYSRRTAMPLVDRLELPSVEIEGVLVIRPFSIGQPVPVVKAIPQAEKIREAIEAIEAEGNTDLLARWEDFGCATFDQLKLMESVVTARNYFKLVQATVDWIGKVDFQVGCIVEPFKDTSNTPKADIKQAVEDLNLGRWYVGKHPQHGHEFLDFREDLWLHSGTIIGALLMLRATYDSVGVVNPRFHDFDTKEQKMRIARSYVAADPGVKRIISVVNLGHHWGAFFVDVREKMCYVFDPMHLKSNVSELKNAVSTVIEEMLDLTDQLQYECITGCEQKDSTSCGLWCVVVLELCLYGATPKNWCDYWSDSLYDLVSYLRMRYLHKVIKLQSHSTGGHDE